jgi:hypothetical protein
MPELVEVKALEGYKIWVRYSDGEQGVVDLSDLAGRGVFAHWNDDRRFRSVHLGPGNAVSWTDEVELCPDSVYLRLTAKAPEEVLPALGLRHAGA